MGQIITKPMNLANVMIATNRKIRSKEIAVIAQQTAMDAEVKKLILESKELAAGEERIDAMKLLGFNYKLREAASAQASQALVAHLPPERTFTTAAIKKVCIAYGLRLLHTSYYKGALDDGIPAAIAEFQKLNGGKLPCARMIYDRSEQNLVSYDDREKGPLFMIAAPAESFVLQNKPAPDPLLFCCLGNHHWYLVHKWGGDISIFRRVTSFIREYKCAFGIPMQIAAAAGWVTFTALRGWWGGPELGSAAFFGVIAIGVLPQVILWNSKRWKDVPSEVWCSVFKS